MSESDPNDPPYLTKELRELDLRLITLRTDISPKMRAIHVSRLRQLLPVFSEMQRLVLDVENILSDCRYGTEYELNRLLETNEILILVEREIQRIGDSSCSLVNDDILFKLLNLCEHEINQIFLVINQRSSIAQYYAPWFNLVTEAREERAANTGALKHLIQTIIGDSTSVNTIEEIIPSAQHLGIKWSAQAIHEDYPFIAGVMVAQMVAYCVPRFPRGDEYVEELIGAALLHDVGLIPLLSGYHQNIKQLVTNKNRLFQSHPVNSAIIAGRFKEMPVTFPYIIRQHHERLNGNGFPENLIDKSLPPLSRALGIFCRLNDLLVGTSFVQSSQEMKESKPLSLIAAGKQLKLEANLGELDQKLVGQILEILGLDNSNLVIQTLKSDRLLRIDQAHQDILAPNLDTPLVTSWSWQKQYSRGKIA